MPLHRVQTETEINGKLDNRWITKGGTERKKEHDSEGGKKGGVLFLSITKETERGYHFSALKGPLWEMGRVA